MNIPIYVGFDQREAAVFHVFNQSVIEHAQRPISIHPLSTKSLRFDGQRDGTNAFIFSRYLVPYLQDYQGWAIFCDGDQIVQSDICGLWDLRDESKALMCVKHEYKTCSQRKYVGSPIENDNVDYPRKNWSSVMLFNCGHPANRKLTPEYVSSAKPHAIHRFAWLKDEEIGDLPIEWNWLEGEYRDNPNAKLVHHTLGTPGFEYYKDSDSSSEWNEYLLNALEIVGEDPVEVVSRASQSRQENEKLKVA